MAFINRLKKAAHILKNDGLPGFIEALKNKLAHKFPKLVQKKKMTVQEVFEKRFPQSLPPKTLRVKHEIPRLNLIIDSLAKDSFYGGAATALILATLCANRLKIPLRIISRTHPSYTAPFNELLNLFQIEKPSGLQFFSDWSMVSGPRSRRLELSSKDIFLASSWWSSQVIQEINPLPYYFYILQEDEALFYPSGDEQLKSVNSFKCENAHYLINTKILYDHLSHSSMLPINAKNAVWFEPAISSIARNGLKKPSENRYKLFFYGRPNHPRNLYYHGLHWLDAALNQGILKSDEWEIFVGGCDSVSPFYFNNRIETHFLGKLSWQEYRELIGSIDLCFSLMCTPHPSYPPLDFAASGAVVLTNQFGNKQSLPYSRNIICCPLDTNSMLKGFTEAEKLVKDNHLREKNFAENLIETNWEKALKTPLEYMEKIVNAHAPC